MMLSNRQFQEPPSLIEDIDGPDMAAEAEDNAWENEKAQRRAKALRKHNERQGVYEPSEGDPW